MRRYEITLKFTLVSEGPAVALNRAEEVHEYLAPFYQVNPLAEQFMVVTLNRKNRCTGVHRVTTGTLTNTLVCPREVFRTAILNSAAVIIVAHNHPSGDPTPSAADIQVTRQLREAAKVISIELMDHVISGEKSEDPCGQGYYSFRSAGLL